MDLDLARFDVLHQGIGLWLINFQLGFLLKGRNVKVALRPFSSTFPATEGKAIEQLRPWLKKSMQNRWAAVSWGERLATEMGQGYWHVQAVNHNTLLWKLYYTQSTNGSLELHIPCDPRPVLGKHGFSLGTVTMLEYWNSSRRARILAI